MSEFKTTFTPRWDYYHCQMCARAVITVAVQRGNYPNVLHCQSIPGHPPQGCDGVLRQRSDIRRDKWPEYLRERQPDLEWYAPKGHYERMKIKKASPKLYEYLMQGGLLMRSPTAAHDMAIVDEPEPEPTLQDHVEKMIAALKADPTRCPYDGNLLDHDNQCPIHGNPEELF